MTTLLDIGVALAGLLGAALIVYGAWLCLLATVNPPKRSPDENQSDAFVRKPGRRVRAGTGERELRGSQGRV